MRMIHKASTLDADAIILDLEDAVPLTEKETARIFIKDSIDLVGSGNSSVYVRVNALTTKLTMEDLEAVALPGLEGIVLPKCESHNEVISAEKLIGKVERKKKLKLRNLVLLPTLETAKGVLNSYEIASASKRVAAISFGAVDFTRDMGTSISRDGSELMYARSRIAVAARAAEVQAIDTPWIDIADRDGFVKDSRFARQLGFRGKLLIHPGQIQTVNEVFSPSQGEVEYAKKVVDAFQTAQAKGLGAISLEGRMIDIANYRQARDLLALAEAIAEREQSRKEKAQS